MILYFTGTGNSTYVAEKIAEMTADSLISMTDKIRENSCENINAEKLLYLSRRHTAGESRELWKNGSCR